MAGLLKKMIGNIILGASLFITPAHLYAETVNAAKSCNDCRNYFANLCGKSECSAIGEKLGKDCIFTPGALFGDSWGTCVTPIEPINVKGRIVATEIRQNGPIKNYNQKKYKTAKNSQLEEVLKGLGFKEKMKNEEMNKKMIQIKKKLNNPTINNAGFVDDSDYINEADMKVLVEKCEYSTPEDAAACVFSSMYLRKSDKLKKGIYSGTSKSNLNLLVSSIDDDIERYYDRKFTLKPFRYVDGKRIGKMDHHKFKIKDGGGGGGTFFAFFIKEDGRWVCDIDYSINSLQGNKKWSPLDYKIFLPKSFVEEKQIKYIKNNYDPDWVEIPPEEVRKLR